MTEPENFEEDLFADLYTEDDVPAKPAVAITESRPEINVPIETRVEESAEQNEQNGESEQQTTFSGEQDMDDEIDFNLGNGNGYDVPTTQESHGPGIKEDG